MQDDSKLARSLLPPDHALPPLARLSMETAVDLNASRPSPVHQDGSHGRSSSLSPVSSEGHARVRRRSFSHRTDHEDILTGSLDPTTQWAATHRHTDSGSSSADLGSANMWHIKSPSVASTFETPLERRWSQSDTHTLSDVASLDTIPANENDRTRLTTNYDIEHDAYPPRKSDKRRKSSYASARRSSFLHAATSELRRLSFRVVNLVGANVEADQKIRLPDDDGPFQEGEAVVGQLGTLRGKSLFLFGPDHPIRQAAKKALLWSWTEPIVLLLIILNVVVLTIQAAPDVFQHPRPASPGYFHAWEDAALFALMCIFTLEALVRIVVSGLLFADQGTMLALPTPARQAQGLVQDPDKTASPFSQQMPDKQGYLFPRTPFRYAISRQQEATSSSTPFLRHSYNRIDLVAVISFWITFALATSGLENKQWLYVFRALSVLRASRLLTVTAGSSVILQSLKKAAPLLANVAVFVLFAIVLFSIIGVQSFKGSFSRNCLWVDPAGQSNYTSGQLCGGYYENAHEKRSFLLSNGEPSNKTIKGYLCPVGQICIAGGSPSNGTESFDNIGLSSVQVFIVASANSWSPTMYNMMDADYFAASLFFIVCLIVLNFWLINIFVAVITTTFANITDETKHSAFGTAAPAVALEVDAEDKSKSKAVRASDFYKRVYSNTRYLWVVLILVDVILQATRTDKMSTAHKHMLIRAEGIFTGVFAVEILLRFFFFFPHWRSFLSGKSNLTDLSLAVITAVIQIPVIRNSRVYPWLTFFQLARFYRVMLAIPRIRRLLVKLSGSIVALLNMILFLFMMTFIASLMAVQFLRGQVPEEIEGEEQPMTFFQIYNSFLATYQLLTSENWTNILFAVTGSKKNIFNLVLALVFLLAWFAFSNFILVRMFIAVINEAFSAGQDEKEKHEQQMERYLKSRERRHREGVSNNWLGKYNPYFWVTAKSDHQIKKKGVVPSNLVLPLRKAVVREYTTGINPKVQTLEATPARLPKTPLTPTARLRVLLGRSKAEQLPEEIPLRPLREEEDFDRMDRHLDLLASQPENDEELLEIAREQRAAEADFIAQHPSYDRPLWLIPQKWKLRRWAQSVVAPGYGHRVFGKQPVPEYVTLFNGLVLASVVGSITVAAIATPAYRQGYFIDHGNLNLTWFNITEVSLGFIFLIEFAIKVIADGFLFCPNAYLLSIWNGFDFLVMLTLIVNIVTTLVSPDGVSRLTRALKAFRALRLITLLPRIRSTFYHALILGASKLLDASVLAMLYIIPFAVWGQNLFSGLLYFCNDSVVETKLQCVGEYVSSPANWEFLAPRAWTNPYVWSFDSFRNSFLVLFEIISLEGWTNVLQSALSITGFDQQPRLNAGQVNGIFFVIYILFGGITILALFVSVIIENFTRSSGNALLTSEQRQWIDLKKILHRQRPSRRPRKKPTSTLRAWCYQRAVEKHGWWSRGMTSLYLLHIVLLMTETAKENQAFIKFRDVVFLLLTCTYLVDIVVRVMGIGWSSFRRNWWNLYDIFVVTGTFATTIPSLSLEGPRSDTVVQLQKLFLVSISFKLVQKNNSLNTLFKTSVASLPAIFDLVMLWLALFFVWAIAYLEVFSLTRWQINETYNRNYTTFGKTLVMLAFMSVGEGWNSFMHDYTVQAPLCTDGPNFLFSDCGSPPWAFVLFISWNIISMYIFANMFTGVVVENFAYVTQLYGRVKMLKREEMRAFKLAWADLDTNRTGYLKRKQFPAFFARLTGIFEVKIYPEEASVANLRRICGTSYNASPSQSGIDLVLLNKKLQSIDFGAIQKRRRVYSRLFHEAMLTADREKGLSFTDMLFLLAHYKLRQDDSALRIEEQIQRQEKMERVNDLVSLDKVRGLLTMMHDRRQYLQHRRRSHADVVPAIAIYESETPQLGHGPFTPLRSLTPSPPNSPTLNPRASPISPRESFSFTRQTDTGSDIDVLEDLQGSAWMKLAKRNSDEDDSDE